MATQPIELALNRSDSCGAALVGFTDRLLVLLSTMAPDYPSLDTTEFRTSVDRWRDSLRTEVEPSRVVPLVTRVVSGCELYFQRVRAYEGEREAEFGEIVGVLRDVLGTLRGDADTFDTKFEQSTAQLARLSHIEDIRELRRAVASEVDALKRIVAERKEREEAAFFTLTRRVETLEANLRDAREEASKDGLTGLANRRTFDRAMARCLARAQRGDFKFTLALIDIDDFKAINDKHGHPVGDRVLVCVAQLLASFVRSNDLAARYGGEEFAILLEQTGVAQARARLNGLIDSVARRYEYERDGKPESVSFTFSIGATESAQGDTGEDVTRRADEALYLAKRKGKKRLEVSTKTLLKRLLS